jgi:hypothetical protein
MTDRVPRSVGISGDFGWSDGDEKHTGVMNSALLIVVLGLHWAILWLLGGLVQLPWIARRVRSGRQPGWRYRKV